MKATPYSISVNSAIPIFRKKGAVKKTARIKNDCKKSEKDMLAVYNPLYACKFLPHNIQSKRACDFAQKETILRLNLTIM